MQLRKSQIIASMVLASSMVFAPMAVNAANHNDYQQYKTHASHMKYQKNHFRAMSGLELSQEQKDQAFKIRHDNEAAVYEQKKIVKAAHKELFELSKADKFDQDKAKKAASELGQAKGELALIRAKSRADFMALLTPEQKQKMADFRNKRSKK